MVESVPPSGHCTHSQPMSFRRSRSGHRAPARTRRSGQADVCAKGVALDLPPINDLQIRSVHVGVIRELPVVDELA